MDNARPTGWVGWVYFASTMMLIVGVMHIIAGLTGIFNSDFYVATQTGQLIAFNYQTWGWVQLLLGILVFATGAALWQGRLWARAVTLVLVSLLVVVNIITIGTYPWWSVIGLVINAFVIYAVTLHGNEMEASNNLAAKKEY